ncbi:hypothetical protein [Arthrobacter sp. RCC_34]|uniref:hypothetical protein n=1 Tax=Arthrobacter sp. RCC_34 TaxID=3239230 RepID=UPI003524238C
MSAPENAPAKPDARDRLKAWMDRRQIVIGTSFSLALSGAMIFINVVPGLAAYFGPAGKVAEAFGTDPVKSTITDVGLILFFGLMLFMFRQFPQPRLYALAPFRTPRRRLQLELAFIFAVLVVGQIASNELGKFGLKATGDTDILNVDLPAYRVLSLSARAGLWEEFSYFLMPVAFAITLGLMVTGITRRPARWAKSLAVVLLLVSAAGLLGGHVYQGFSGLPGHAVWILTHATLYLLFRRLWPMVLVHFLWDMKAGGIIPSDTTVEVILAVVCAGLAIWLGRKLFPRKTVNIS